MTEAPAKINAIAPWFGSKRTLAPRIVAELGPHAAYWEPFCGSMAVLLAKPRATMETVNDLHGDLINLARTIQHPRWGPSLYRALRRAVFSAEAFENSLQTLQSCRAANDPSDHTPDLWWAHAYFIVSWMGRNGSAGTDAYNGGFCKRYTKSGGHGATRFANAVSSIPTWRRRLRDVTILNEDAFALLGKIEDAKGVVVYCDPPYLVKGCTYLHDFSAEEGTLHGDDHARLAAGLARFAKTRVVVSYYDHPRLAELYPPDRWTKVHCPTTKALVNQGMRDKGGATVAPEVLLINGPSLTAKGAES